MSSGSGSPGEGISRQTWEGSASAIAVTDASGAIEYVNPAFERLTGYTAVDAVGQNMRILKSGAHPPEFYVELWGTITAGGKWSGRMQNSKACFYPINQCYYACWHSLILLPRL